MLKHNIEEAWISGEYVLDLLSNGYRLRLKDMDTIFEWVINVELSKKQDTTRNQIYKN